MITICFSTLEPFDYNYGNHRSPIVLIGNNWQGPRSAALLLEKELIGQILRSWQLRSNVFQQFDIYCAYVSMLTFM